MSTVAATTVGIGPRYLHSTGQYHKGGPPNGIFLQLYHSYFDPIEQLLDQPRLGELLEDREMVGRDVAGNARLDFLQQVRDLGQLLTSAFQALGVIVERVQE